MATMSARIAEDRAGDTSKQWIRILKPFSKRTKACKAKHYHNSISFYLESWDCSNKKGFLAELPCRSVPTIQPPSLMLQSSPFVTSFARERGAWHRCSICMMYPWPFSPQAQNFTCLANNTFCIFLQWKQLKRSCQGWTKEFIIADLISLLVSIVRSSSDE